MTLKLQYINDHLYPTSSIDSRLMEESYHLSRIPLKQAYRWLPKLVKDGFKMEIINLPKEKEKEL